jgi:hypothetical protein
MAKITNIRLKGNWRFRRRPGKITPFYNTHAPPSLIINNSVHALNHKQITLLNKGMNFCPTSKTNKTKTKTKYYLHKFRKRLRNQYKYGVSDPEGRLPFIMPSHYSAIKTINTLETYMDKIETYTTKQLFNHNQSVNTHKLSMYPTIESLISNFSFFIYICSFLE